MIQKWDNIFSIGLIRITVAVNDLLVKYLDDEGKAAVVTGAGKCRVCGGFHHSRKEWKNCALNTRIVGHPRWKLTSLTFPHYISILPNYLIDIQIQSIDDVIKCTIPEERMDEATEEIKATVKRYKEMVIRKLGKFYKKKLISSFKKAGILIPDNLPDESPEDVLFSTFTFLMLERPDVVKVSLDEKGEPTLILPKWLSGQLRYLSLTERMLLADISEWVWERVDEDTKSSLLPRVRKPLIEKVDTRRGRALLRIKTSPSDPPSAFIRLEVDLRSFEVFHIFPEKASLLKSLETNTYRESLES